MMKRVTCAGKGFASEIYQFAMCLAKHGGVFVADNTLTREIMNKISDSANCEIYERENVIFAAGISIEKSDLRDFDFVVVCEDL